MSRRKKHAAHANHERWLVSYADFITLLFAFFVVMYSSSQVDKRKVGRLALAIQVAFQELGVFQASTTKVPLNSDQPIPLSDQQIFENIDLGVAYGRISPSAGSDRGLGEGTNARELKERLEKALAPEIREKAVDIRQTPDGLVLSLHEIGFYDTGSDVIRKEAEPALERLAGVLAPYPNGIRIEGHTDNVPIHTARFPSNWELSTARAIGLVRLFITKYGFAPGRLSGAGFAEFHPVASNETAEGRGLNRRVDLVIIAPVRPGAHIVKETSNPSATTKKPPPRG